MSNVKRYGFPWLECDATDEAYMQDNGMTELKDGGFVLWADYARLKDENARLRKAGDQIVEGYEKGSVDGFNIGLMMWQDAKEVQS